jgi:hypothetical protein
MFFSSMTSKLVASSPPSQKNRDFKRFINQKNSQKKLNETLIEKEKSELLEVKNCDSKRKIAI